MEENKSWKSISSEQILEQQLQRQFFLIKMERKLIFKSAQLITFQKNLFIWKWIIKHDPERFEKIQWIGTCFDWAINRFGPALGIEKGDYTHVEKVLNTISLGCKGLVYHPYLSTTGERCPFMNPVARAQFTGLSLEHTAAHMLRAVYEGVGYSLMDCISVLAAYPVNQFRVCGGGARSPFIMQMLADMTGIETVCMKGQQAGARGAAIIASVAAGVFQNIKEATDKILVVKESYKPNLKNKEKYQKMYQLYQAIQKSSMSFWSLREETTTSVNQ